MPILLLTLFWEIEPPLYVTFPALCAVSLVATLAGTWLTRPTEGQVLTTFYARVRPFGFWGPIRDGCDLTAAELAAPAESLRLAVVNLLLSSTAILGCHLGPMYLVGHWHGQAAGWLVTAGVAGALLYFTWYRKLGKTHRCNSAGRNSDT